METRKILLSQVKVNSANPRTIKQAKLHLLAERMLAFPKMLAIRPVVVDKTMTVLGGNMRVRALQLIVDNGIEWATKTLRKTKNFQRLTAAEGEAALNAWAVWLDKPTIEVVEASELSDAEKKEFIIADNASFGDWDYDALANEWDTDELSSWGVDVWKPDYTSYGDNNEGGTSSTGGFPNIPADSFTPSNLPDELKGTDITPDDLPKIEGSNETAMERIIIVYPKEREDDVAQLVGLEKIEKVVYNLEDLGL